MAPIFMLIFSKNSFPLLPFRIPKPLHNALLLHPAVDRLREHQGDQGKEGQHDQKGLAVISVLKEPDHLV